MEYQPKSNKKYMPVSHFISSFESASHKKLQNTATSSLISCCFRSAFTSTDIIFYNLLQYLKKDFRHKFSLFNRFMQNKTPIHLTTKIC